MKKGADTEYKALTIIAEMIIQFGTLHILNISTADSEALQSARDGLEKIIQQNGYRINYDRNIKSPIIKS
ncbi:hypothetical protein DRF65_13735 [Chryseobacterium pennae]|uniref:Uncharacterized protein n=1 Tax=Chryseobacterium pennae TaxID=2258962 RepID=A0A3D9C7E1_9FLAO|nr:hypothetical protein [Chryseobacterium pennae]REC61795.1 hypothetical protein DRF65_13735 [Chryseobacterium pennae]